MSDTEKETTCRDCLYWNSCVMDGRGWCGWSGLCTCDDDSCEEWSGCPPCDPRRSTVVVFCEDCSRWERSDDGQGWCKWSGRCTDESGFCAWGERRTDAER